jgi:hypothetical protein
MVETWTVGELENTKDVLRLQRRALEDIKDHRKDILLRGFTPFFDFSYHNQQELPLKAVFLVK